jgi:DNA-binding NtrC family response regulator
VVIEDPDLRRQVEAAVAEARGRSVHAADEATLLRSLERQAISMVFAAAGSSAPTLERVLLAAHRRRPDAPVIVVASGSAPYAAPGQEAFDVVRAPIDRSQLELVVRRAALQHELLAEVARLRGLCGTPDPLEPLVGRSEAMAVLRERIAGAAARGRSLLLVGERGTGRGLAARTLHAASSRRAGPFVMLDGVRREESTDEPAARGWADDALEQARGGTLFVAEADRLDFERQRQLVAGLRARSAAEPPRLVSSAARDLESMVREGAFDAELAALLAEEVLRDRERDMLLIARRQLETLCALNGLAPARLEPATLALLESYRWPGNVAELRETVEGALTLATDGVIRPEHLSERIRGALDELRGADAAGSPRRFRDAKRRVVDSFERSYLEELLGWHRGNVTAAAEQAGMLRSALQRLLRKHDLRSSEFRDRGRGGTWRAS